MHFAFFYMMIRIPFRLLDVEHTKDSIEDQKWIHHMIFLSIGSVMNILEYSRYLPGHPFSLLINFIGLIYLAATAKIGVSGEFDLNEFVDLNLGTSFMGMSYIMYSKFSQKTYLNKLNKKIEIIYESKLIIENLEQSILIMTPEGKIHFANDSYIRYFDSNIHKFMNEFSYNRIMDEREKELNSCLSYFKRIINFFRKIRRDEIKEENKMS